MGSFVVFLNDKDGLDKELAVDGREGKDRERRS